jgi:4-alpha-glucanotransferase
MTTTQDLLDLGHEARMNTPSTLGPPNWCWRLREGALTDKLAEKLLMLTAVYGRLRPTEPKEVDE